MRPINIETLCIHGTIIARCDVLGVSQFVIERQRQKERYDETQKLRDFYVTYFHDREKQK